MPSGQPHIEIQLMQGPVDSSPIGHVSAGCGAECVFLGRTRAETHPAHGELRQLSYEAYEPMARSVLDRLAHEAIERFGCFSITILHAVGDVPIGQASVLVRVLCGHRAEAFEACRMLIDRLKVEAPIWKREVWADGTTWSRGRQVEVKEVTQS